MADFRSTQPLTGYDRYEPYVRRIYEGEENVMTAEKPILLGKTSGTTGTTVYRVFVYIIAFYWYLYTAIFLVYDYGNTMSVIIYGTEKISTHT